jgi:hypothetical protein
MAAPAASATAAANATALGVDLTSAKSAPKSLHDARMDLYDAKFAKMMDEQNKKFFADKPDEAFMTPEMKQQYESFEKMIKEHTDKFNKKMREHSAEFKAKYAAVH